MQRRDFIKITSLGLGGFTIAGLPFLSSCSDKATGNIPVDGEIFKRYPTYCEVCFWKCAGWTYADDKGNIWKIVGNEDDPHCNGRLCPRGTGGIGMYNDEDRLKTPLIRTSDRGKQTFREASWDEAFDYIAGKMKDISGKSGGESLALFTHGSGGKYFETILRALGSDAIAAPSYAQCRGPREVGFITTFGDGVNSPEPTDIRDTKCLVLIGSHIGENMHNGQIQEMSDAIDKGASIITVDPRFSTAASKSKYWLPIKPATDIALLLSWMNVLISNEWYDKKYVDKYCSGFDKLKEYVKDFTPEWAYGITNIEPELIINSVKEMFNASPSVIIHPGRHVTWYGDDVQRSRAIAIMNALLGSWGRKGGFYFPAKAQLKHKSKPEYPKPKKSWRDACNGKFNLADLPLANVIIDASKANSTANHTYKGWIVNGTNLIPTIPNSKNTLEAIQNLELLVVVDTMPMEITGWADVVLPECTYLERFDTLRADQYREASIALRMPAAKPKYNSKPAWWMAKELSKKLGLEQYFEANSLEEELEWELKAIGSSLEEMKKIGVKKLNNPDHKLYLDGLEDYQFNTNSGKIELYSTALESEGFDPLPKFTPMEEPADGFYRLIYGRAPMHTFSRTANNPNLVDLMKENLVWVNPKVAKIWDLKPDQTVWLKNQDGVVSSFPIKVRITERIRWDSVYMVHGFGHADKRLTRAYGRGASDSELITKALIDPIMGGTGMRGNFVTFLTEQPV